MIKPCRLFPEPGDDRAEHSGGSVGDSQFVVAGRDPSPLFGQTEGAFHNVAASVGLGIEGWRPATAGALVLAGGPFVGLLRDHRFDPTRSQQATDDPIGVGLISDHHIRSCPRSSRADARHPDLIDDLNQHRPVVSLPTGEHHRQRHTVAIDSCVQLRGEPAPGTAHRVTFGLFKPPGAGILVIRPSPLWADQDEWCWTHADGRG